MPSRELFEQQAENYREAVLLSSSKIPKIVIEAGVSMGWGSYAGDAESVIGINRFGASGPGDTVMNKLGLSVPSVIQKVKELINSV